jgi:hypothetical protein
MFTTSNLDDAPQNTLERVQDYVGLHQRFLYYQFVLDAKSRMVEGDYVSAILFAVVALEGVHSAILQISLKDQFKQSIVNDEDLRIAGDRALYKRDRKRVDLTINAGSLGTEHFIKGTGKELTLRSMPEERSTGTENLIGRRSGRLSHVQ